MHKFAIEDGLKKTLIKLLKKDKVTYEILMKKIEEIISTNDVSHYKNLRVPLQDFKRVHVRGPFILTFKYVNSEDKIYFYDFDHHDYIYNKMR
ncbi:MAG: addiction module toxin RelE [Candidatus Woesearchaeota archaeon]